MKYKVTGRKIVVYDSVEIVFEDNGEGTMEFQASQQLEKGFIDEEMINTTYEIESLEVIK